MMNYWWGLGYKIETSLIKNEELGSGYFDTKIYFNDEVIFSMEDVNYPDELFIEGILKRHNRDEKLNKLV